MALIQKYRSLLLHEIVADPEVQSRVSLDEHTIEEYTIDMRLGVVFPGIDVFFDGEHYWLGDGFHRYEAAKRVPEDHIMCAIYSGSKRDALLHSIEANQKHGLRRTNADKRKAVMTLLQDKEWGQWSDREIARRAGVHHSTVASLRSQLSGENRQIERKVQRGDTLYTQNTANIGRKALPEADELLAPLLDEEPADVPAPETPTPAAMPSDEAPTPKPTCNTSTNHQSPTINEQSRPRQKTPEQERHEDEVKDRWDRFIYLVFYAKKVDPNLVKWLYRELAREYHPDKHQNDPSERQERCAQAFAFITDIRTFLEGDEHEVRELAEKKGIKPGREA